MSPSPLHGWRIVKRRHRESAFDGEGARLHGGRWSSRGLRAVYVAASRALATLEILVHLQDDRVLPAYLLCGVRFQAGHVETVDRSGLPRDWRRHPAPRALQRIGDEWIREGRTPVLEVPSAVVEAESNYLLNPTHPRFGELELLGCRPFEIDARLLGREK